MADYWKTVLWYLQARSLSLSAIVREFLKQQIEKQITERESVESAGIATIPFYIVRRELE